MKHLLKHIIDNIRVNSGLQNEFDPLLTRLTDDSKNDDEHELDCEYESREELTSRRRAARAIEQRLEKENEEDLGRSVLCREELEVEEEGEEEEGEGEGEEEEDEGFRRGVSALNSEAHEAHEAVTAELTEALLSVDGSDRSRVTELLDDYRR